MLPVTDQEATLIDHIHIVDVLLGTIHKDRQLVIRDGVIAEVNDAGQAHDPSITRIDAEGAFVAPGLFDMHVHIHDRKYLAVNLAYGVTSLRNLRGLPMHLRWKKELEQGEWLGSTLYTSSPVLDGEKYAHALQKDFQLIF